MKDQLKLRDAIAIGIGGMVGGGIFAVLGLAVSLAKGGTPLAFLFAGILALITAYSYVKLSQKYPSSGGTVKFINQGFKEGVFSGGINNLLWLSYIIMIALYASAFGSYAPNLLSITGNAKIDTHIYESAVIILATAINYYTITFVGKIESVAVVIKLIILLGFVGIGTYGLIGNPNLSQLAVSEWESPLALFAGGMVIFVAYEGFELIANAAPNIINPKKNIALAYYISVIFVVILYIVIAIVTVGSLPYQKIGTAKDYVLAAAAKPMLGQIGFTIITIAALISTFSAINATLLGGSRVNAEVAKDHELPEYFMRQFWHKPIGLIIIGVATLILVNVLRLENISIAGSIGFLLIFSAVNLVGYRLYKEVGGNRIIPAAGCILCLIAVGTLIYKQFETNQLGIAVSGGIILICFAGEWFYTKQQQKRN